MSSPIAASLYPVQNQPVPVPVYAEGLFENVVPWPPQDGATHEAVLALAQKLIAAQRQRIAQLENLALTDELTGLVNRRGLMAALRRELAAAERDGGAGGMVVLCDLNGFKRVNDTYGHQAGDAYLQAVAVALVSELRASDMAARIGGDEFALLLPRLAPDDGAALLRRLDEAFHRRALSWQGRDVPLRASFGSVSYGRGSRPEELLTMADQRLYAQKAERRA